MSCSREPGDRRCDLECVHSDVAFDVCGYQQSKAANELLIAKGHNDSLKCFLVLDTMISTLPSAGPKTAQRHWTVADLC
jgi:hypothetical protein